MKLRNLALSAKFTLAIGIILLIFCSVFSFLLYAHLKNRVIDDAKEKTVIIMTHTKALGDYVRESLRPKMFEILSKNNTDDVFILEAMSTTHVNLQVMKRFRKNLPEYVFRRVSRSPLNPENLADEYHAGMIDYFEKNGDKKAWEGIVHLNGKESLVYIRPVVSDMSCLRCHGDRDAIPRSFLALYGGKGKFGWKANEIVGVESVSIPLDLAFANVRKVALDTFLLGVVMMILLFFALFGIFRQLVANPLRTLSDTFRNIVGGTEPLGREIPVRNDDEIGDLTRSFNTLSDHLRTAEERLKKTAEIEKQMIASEKLAALGQLSAGVAHEINNPLGGIKLCFNNMMDTEMDEETTRENREVINAGFDRIQNIVGQLLDYSKNSQLAMEAGSVCKIISNVLKLVEYTMSKKDITLIKELSGDIPDIVMDANKMEQVFLNLLINAVQATGVGGTVAIRTRSDGAVCSVTITNTGPRVPDEVLARIFDPFFTTKDVGEGTGLGLTVSKSIVEQHKGVIEVSTNETETTFTVKLPVI